MTGSIDISCVILAWNSESYVRHRLESGKTDLQNDALNY